jgi:hypothetical protein
MKGIYKLLATLFVLDVCLLVLSGLPGTKDATHGYKWVLGGIGWFGFMVTTVALVAVAVTALVRRGRRTVSA